MIRFLADENFDNRVVRGLRRRLSAVDIVRIQDVGLDGAPDPAVIAWAADAGRIILTHDVKTFSDHAFRRVGAGLPMAGVVEIPRHLTIRAMIDDLLLIATASEPDDWAGQVRYLPL